MEIVNKVITNIYNDLNMGYFDICKKYDQNEIFYDEIMKHKDISCLNQKDFDFMAICIDAYIEKYDSSDRLELKNLLLEHTSCGLQHDGWTCNSCFHSMTYLDLSTDIHDYWLAVLFFRGDYHDFDWSEYDTSIFQELINELIIKLKQEINDETIN
tara:strand:+ start:66 stop:533 length:468 start_codon:yes stop_codon:yes gene_type:complete